MLIVDQQNGTWRSLVARFLGVEEVAGSNPVVPIKFNHLFICNRFRLRASGV